VLPTAGHILKCHFVLPTAGHILKCHFVLPPAGHILKSRFVLPPAGHNLKALLYLERSQTHQREHSENHMKVEENTISFYIDELVNSTLSFDLNK
jgi:hypothetical protein